MFKKIAMIVIGVIILGVGTISVVGKISPLSWQLWGDVNQDGGIAIDGYDAVSYHLAGEPMQGDAEFSTSWDGVEWHFASAQNKALFEQNPSRYTPEYGGYCAFAVLKSLTADVDPQVWHIHNNKLYLFASQDPKDKWVSEIPQGSLETSDQNWDGR